jgi:hypothetical protein
MRVDKKDKGEWIKALPFEDNFTFFTRLKYGKDLPNCSIFICSLLYTPTHLSPKMTHLPEKLYPLRYAGIFVLL